MQDTINYDQLDRANQIVFNRTILSQISENPSARILNLEEVSLDHIVTYLQSIHSTTWGQTYSILSYEGMEKAALFLQDALNGLYRIYSGV